LDGGLPNWKSNGFPVNSDGSQLLLDEDAAAAVQNVYSGKEVQFTNIVLLLLQL
jgi:hypothetical protein